jgi:WhiB family redox-sensing transcriptional regulator
MFAGYIVKGFTSRCRRVGTVLWGQRRVGGQTDRRRQRKDKEFTAMDWRHRSACLDEDPELFFPIGNTGPALLQIEEAKAVCRRCEVREQCLTWALEAGQDHGVWGGLSEDERRALKRRNARARIRSA